MKPILAKNYRAYPTKDLNSSPISGIDSLEQIDEAFWNRRFNHILNFEQTLAENKPACRLIVGPILEELHTARKDIREPKLSESVAQNLDQYLKQLEAET